MTLRRLAPRAAFLNAGVALATLLVALVLIGPAALADGQRLVQLAIENPAPLLVQDALKLAAAGLALVLIAALHRRLAPLAPARLRAATGFGLASALCLAANAGLSLLLIGAAADPSRLDPDTRAALQAALAVLGMAAIALNGAWHLLVHTTALRHARLPRGLCRLGQTMGGLSLVPPLGVVVLALSVPWSIWLGRALGARP